MGAFDYGRYRRNHDGREDARLGAAIIAIKRELVYVGFARPKMDVDLPFFGEAVENSVKDFQKARNITVDGEVGQTTGRALFRDRIVDVESLLELPAGTLGKKIALESAFDPAAVGFVDPDDKGLCQINTRIHTVSEAQAFDPEFSVVWAGEYVLAQKREIERRANTMKAARAAYNVGNFYAAEWMLAGFPPDGRLVSGIDWYERATKYLALVDAKAF
jgi:hypothetical protein